MANGEDRFNQFLNFFGLPQADNEYRPEVGPLRPYPMGPSPSERQIAPGITAVAGPMMNVSQELGTYTPNYLIDQAANPSSPITGVEFPDGLKVQGSFVPPPPPVTTQGPMGPAPSTTAQPTSAEVAEGLVTQLPYRQQLNGLNAPLQPVSPIPQPTGQTTNQPGGFNQFIRSPSFRYMLGRLAQVFGARDQTGIGFQLGQFASEAAMSSAYANYLQRLQAGEAPQNIKGPDVDILLPELRQQAVQLQQAQQALGLQERRVAVEEKQPGLRQQEIDIAADRNRLAEATELTREEKQSLAQAELSAAEGRSWIANRYLRVNEVTIFDTKTGKIIQTPAGPGGGGSGAFQIGNFKDIPDYVVGDFLNDAVASWKAANDPEGKYDKLRVLTEVFQSDPNGGSPNWQKVFAQLPPEKQEEFRQRMGQYVGLAFQGLHPSFGFSIGGPQPAQQTTPSPAGGTQPTINPTTGKVQTRF